MRTAYLIRMLPSETQTLGVFSVEDNDQIWTCKTLELPWKDNSPMISCIPPGEYVCKKYLSPSKQKELYQVMNVPNRSGVLIHSANYNSQLRGCIALGDAHKDLNGDGSLDTVHSGKTMERFQEIMKWEDFKLRVIKI